MHIYRFTLLSHFLITLGFSISSQESFCKDQYNYIARPHIHSFWKKDYNAANQNWSISQCPNGYMYFGNTAGLLEYNGSEWAVYKLPDKLIIRSVFADYDGRIYTGAHEEFGYWERDNFGKLAYTSLVGLLPKGFTFSNEDIWTIKRIRNKIYFQSFSKIYSYDGKRIRTSFYDKPIFSLMEYDNMPVISFIGGGTKKVLPNGKLSPLANTPNNLTVNNIIKISKDTTLLITEQDGINLIVKNNYAGVWKCLANTTLKEAQINRSLLLKGKFIVIGTINNGIVLVDLKGRIIKRLDSNNGLQNNTILSIYIDKSQNLWAGLDKGIDFINLAAPYSFYIEKAASIGSVYCASPQGNYLYVGTNHGLFYAKWIPSNNDNLTFTSIPNVKGQVWNLQTVDGALLCGGNSGTYILNNGQAFQISTTNGANQIAKPNINSHLLFQGTYTGISIFSKKVNGTWSYSKPLKNFWSPVKTIQFDHENTIWVGDIYKGLYRIWLNDRLDSATRVVKYGKKDGFPSDYNIQVHKLGSNIVFSTTNKFYTFDYINRKFIEYHNLNATLKNFTSSHTIYQTEKDEYWFASTNTIKAFYKYGERLKPGLQFTYNALGTSAVDGFENIWKLSSSTFLLGLDNGFMIYNASQKDKQHSRTTKPTIYKIEISNNDGETKLASIVNKKSRISFRWRNITFHVSVPGEIKGLFTYYYKFDNNEKWMLSKDGIIAINSLSSGSHTLYVKAINLSTNQSCESEFTFTISPPWYSHPITLIIYMLLFFALYKGLRLLSVKRQRKQKYEYLMKIKELNHNRLENLQKEHLQMQVENKANELANYTMLISAKNDVLQKIKVIIDDFSSPDASSINKMRKGIVSLIEKDLSNKNEWEQFQGFFDEANKAFTSRLKKAHPELTPNDLRFCSFLRMNISSKEISQLLNISERSVEVKRYRLRKRLNMEHDQNLTKYLMDI